MTIRSNHRRAFIGLMRPLWLASVLAIASASAPQVAAAGWNGCGGSVWGCSGSGRPSEGEWESSPSQSTGPDTFWEDLSELLFRSKERAAQRQREQFEQVVREYDEQIARYQQIDQKVRALVENGDTAHRQRDFEDAQGLYRQALRFVQEYKSLDRKFETTIQAKLEATQQAIAAAREATTQAAAELIRAVEDAGRYSGCTGPVRCNLFVAKIAELRAPSVPYFRNHSSKLADEMYGFLAKAVASPGSGWRKVEPGREAQELANRGRFVVGVAHSPSPQCWPVDQGTECRRHGHIVVAVPDVMPRNPANKGRSGPWVRDNENAHKSVRSSAQFHPRLGEPIWAVWEPDMVGRQRIEFWRPNMSGVMPSGAS